MDLHRLKMTVTHKKMKVKIISVCPQKPPVLSLRGAFLATKQSQPFYEGIASLKNRLQQKTPRNVRVLNFRTDSN